VHLVDTQALISRIILAMQEHQRKISYVSFFMFVGILFIGMAMFLLLFMVWPLFGIVSDEHPVKHKEWSDRTFAFVMEIFTFIWRPIFIDIVKLFITIPIIHICDTRRHYNDLPRIILIVSQVIQNVGLLYFGYLIGHIVYLLII
jgi:hypothetical protein